jgi:hypothetical protein
VVVIVINIADFRINIEDPFIKSLAFINSSKHHSGCLIYQDGPCTCGLEEVIEDEMREEFESAAEES